MKEDLLDWYPEIAGKVKITLVEAMPHVLPMFSKQLIEYTEEHFAKNKVHIMSSTKFFSNYSIDNRVKQVNPKEIVVQTPQNELETIPYGLLVWATGNTARPLVSDLIKKLPSELQNQRRGLVVDDYLRVKGSESIYALGDASATKQVLSIVYNHRFPPTAQVASRQGEYLAEIFNEHGRLDAQLEISQISDKEKSSALPAFEHKSLGMLA